MGVVAGHPAAMQALASHPEALSAISRTRRLSPTSRPTPTPFTMRRKAAARTPTWRTTPRALQGLAGDNKAMRRSTPIRSVQRLSANAGQFKALVRPAGGALRCCEQRRSGCTTDAISGAARTRRCRHWRRTRQHFRRLPASRRRSRRSRPLERLRGARRPSVGARGDHGQHFCVQQLREQRELFQMPHRRPHRTPTWPVTLWRSNSSPRQQGDERAQRGPEGVCGDGEQLPRLRKPCEQCA